MESEQTEVVKQEQVQEQQVTQQPTIEAPNSMTDPTMPKPEPIVTNDQLNQLISKLERIENQQGVIFAQMQQQKDDDKGGSNDGLKY